MNNGFSYFVIISKYYLLVLETFNVYYHNILYAQLHLQMKCFQKQLIRQLYY